MEHDLIVYQFSRSKVERGDFRPFLSLCAGQAAQGAPPARDDELLRVLH